MTLAALNLRRSIAGRLAIDGVSVEVSAGTILGIIGANGAGKSTLLRLLAGIDRADAGDIVLDGVPLQTFSASERSRRIAHLPQSAQAHWPLAGRDLVALGRLPHGAGFDRMSTADENAIARAMERTGTSVFATRRVDQISAGERARLLLARVLATEASVVLVDEPIAALDPGYQLEAMGALRDEAVRGAAIAVALHDLAMAAQFCDRLLLLAAGRTVAVGDPESVLQAETLRAVFGVQFDIFRFGSYMMPVAVMPDVGKPAKP